VVSRFPVTGRLRIERRICNLEISSARPSCCW
jgi:hypothetical protein